MSVRRAYQLCLVLIVLFSYCCPAVKSSYYPLYGEGASVSFNSESSESASGSVFTYYLC